MKCTSSSKEWCHFSDTCGAPLPALRPLAAWPKATHAVGVLCMGKLVSLPILIIPNGNYHAI